MMSNQEILEKAIQKAIDSGWEDADKDWRIVEIGGYTFVFTVPAHPEYLQSPEFILYDHDFAKALWGEKEVHHFDLVNLDNGGTSETITKPIWQYHLQQIVIANDPIKYLSDNI